MVAGTTRLKLLSHVLAVGDRGSHVAVQQIVEVVDVLNGQRFVEAVLLFERGPYLRPIGLPLADDRVQRVAGYGVHQHERRDADKKKHDQRLHEADGDVSPETHGRDPLHDPSGQKGRATSAVARPPSHAMTRSAAGPNYSVLLPLRRFRM